MKNAKLLTIFSFGFAFLSIVTACGQPPYYLEQKDLEDSLSSPFMARQEMVTGLKCIADDSTAEPLFLACFGDVYLSGDYAINLGVWAMADDGTYQPVSGKAKQWAANVERPFADRIGAPYPEAYTVDIPGILERAREAL